MLDRREVPRGGRRLCDLAGKHPRVLVAESYDAVRDSCARYLARFHFKVSEAKKGEDLLARIISKPPQVILMESSLPSMHVGRLTEWLALRRRTRQIPVIVMADGPHPFDERIAGTLVKPFGLAQMLQEIRRVLHAARTAH